MAGGGTGGHLFPALALAEELKGRDKDAAIAFMGAKGGLEERIVPKCGYPLRVLSVEGIKRRGPLKKIKAGVLAFSSTMKALGILKEMKPDGVIGSGGYSSAPVVLAARLLGIKTAILEQNALPGLTNRVLGKIADRVYVSFDEARRHFPAGKTILAGNPVRKEILKSSAGRKRVKGERFSILVFGGSQGAIAINAAFLDATEYLTDIWPNLKVVHQTGEDGYEKAKEGYKRKNLKAEVFKFIDDMAGAYESADLVVCRAGATSLAEITALGIPSILIPYPFAADDHQTANARSVADAGGAVMIRQDELTGSTLASAIKRLYGDTQATETMRKKAKGLGRPGAAKTIADDFLKILGKG
ncbi:MAG: undecaprenyldiphospho-muramoylpentapeptide beta-N-acetylglucosaminyltransferase [Deltaproteobacteria bacterium]|nr:undecaprenyldiphospho-muramoylpentapeptide beta-N-acetylglucosaminyltransferase [Deltaproteobacteria bacterium]